MLTKEALSGVGGGFFAARVEKGCLRGDGGYILGSSPGSLGAGGKGIEN
jgi:hypothetical protein